MSPLSGSVSLCLCVKSGHGSLFVRGLRMLRTFVFSPMMKGSGRFRAKTRRREDARAAGGAFGAGDSENGPE